jgi:small subunit ribosomal protein S18
MSDIDNSDNNIDEIPVPPVEQQEENREQHEGNRDQRDQLEGSRDQQEGNRDQQEGSRDSDDHNGRVRDKSYYNKKKVCRFCSQKSKIDYKDPAILRRFTTERGKILARRTTGTCVKHQRKLAQEIKRARIICLLPFVAD